MFMTWSAFLEWRAAVQQPIIDDLLLEVAREMPAPVLPVSLGFISYDWLCGSLCRV